jgi:hypothetical protein
MNPGRAKENFLGPELFHKPDPLFRGKNPGIAVIITPGKDQSYIRFVKELRDNIVAVADDRQGQIVRDHLRHHASRRARIEYDHIAGPEQTHCKRIDALLFFHTVDFLIVISILLPGDLTGVPCSGQVRSERCGNRSGKSRRGVSGKLPAA